jgi:hypothetical protein
MNLEGTMEQNDPAHWKRVAERLTEIGEQPELSPEIEPERLHVESLIEWFKAGQRKDAVLTMQEWRFSVEQWKKTQ